LAKALGYTYIDSGAMYRAVALYALRNGWMNETNIDEEALKSIFTKSIYPSNPTHRENKIFI